MSLAGESSETGGSRVKDNENGIKSLTSQVLDLPPSCLEFSSKWPNYFVVGTYNLQKDDEAQEDETHNEESLEGDLTKLNLEDDLETSNEGKVLLQTDEINISGDASPAVSQTRNGSLLLYSVEDDQLNLVHAVTYPSAILDLHFSPHCRDNFLVASSTGEVSLFALKMEPRPHIALINTYALFDDSSVLILSLAWHKSYTGLFGATFSTGAVGLFQFSPSLDAVLTLRDNLSQSDDYCWTLAFAPTHDDRHKSTIQGVYSGGDDSRLRFLEVTSFNDLELDATLLSERSKGGLKGLGGHDAGVTAILPLPIDTVAGENILLTGSYDDKVRVYTMADHRSSTASTVPKILADLHLGGGVWRLKLLKNYDTVFDPSATVSFRVLASCMFAGAKVLEITGSKTGEWTINVLSVFNEHKSMCYASDAQPSNSDKSLLCVSSSFYDKLLCLWKFEE